LINSILFDIIGTFSPAELKRFRDFLRSPFHNTNKNVIKLFEYFKKFSPDFGSDKAKKFLTKEKVFKKIYPGKKFNDIVLRILLSDLIKLSEEFLTYQGLRKNTFDEYKFLLQELNEKGIDNLYRRIYKEAYKLIEQHDDLRIKYLKLFEYEMNFIDHHLQRNKQQLITSNVLTRSECLISFFILELAGNLHDLAINEQTFNAKFDFNLAYEFINRFDFDGLLKRIKESGFVHYTTLLVYVNMIKAIFNEHDDRSYDDFKETVFDNYDRFSKHEAYNLLTNLETSCLNRRKNNPQKYEAETYFVYELMLRKNNYSYYGEEMGLQRYKNILVNFINLKKFDDVEKFVETYINKVSPDIRDNLYLYSMALINFSKKDFINALQLIQKIKYDYFTLKYDVKNLTLRIYYELKYFENAYSLIDSYKHFLVKNKTVSEFFRERYLNFIGFMNTMIKFSESASNFEIEKLKSNLLKTNNVVSRDWLLEKIDELSLKQL
jgi:hypothetical protein